ncbi:MAG: hypothetical protein NXI32_20835, partial [bacterium]|nr:hypothetical protein [bacterium]
MPSVCSIMKPLKLTSRGLQVCLSASLSWGLLFWGVCGVSALPASDPEDDGASGRSYRGQVYTDQTYGSYSYGQQAGEAYSTEDPYDFALRSADPSTLEKIQYDPQGQYRQPVSIAVLSGQQTLISTKKSGEIYCLYTPSMQVEVIERNAD